MAIEKKLIERVQVEDEDSGSRHELTIYAVFETRQAYRHATVARREGTDYLLDGTESAARIDDSRFRVGTRTFKRWQA